MRFKGNGASHKMPTCHLISAAEWIFDIRYHFRLKTASLDITSRQSPLSTLCSRQREAPDVGIATSRGSQALHLRALCTPSSFLPEGLELHPIAFDIYGSIGPSADKGLNPLFEFISTKKGTSSSTEKTSSTDSAILDSTPALRGCYQSSPIRYMLSVVV